MPPGVGEMREARVSIRYKAIGFLSMFFRLIPVTVLVALLS